MEEALTAISHWPVAEAIRRSFYVYPTINALHILGLGVLIGAILPLDLRLLGLMRWVPVDVLARALTPIAAGGLLLAVVAGFFLFIVKPLEYVGNPPFLVKLGLVALGVVNAASIRVGGAWRQLIETGAIADRFRLQAAASVTLWVAALFAGRWIAFVLG